VQVPDDGKAQEEEQPTTHHHETTRAVGRDEFNCASAG
jgi:hypothetical protein